MSYVPHYIASFEDDTGLDKYLEPFLIPEKAFPTLEDAYAWRGRIKRRIGFTNLGRLKRDLTAASLGLSGASPWTFTIYSTLVAPITGEPQAEIQPGSVIITIAGPIIFTDNGDGTLSSVTPGNSGTIDYSTGIISLTHTAGAGSATTIDFSYYPGLPVMGLPTKQEDAINAESLRAFDTKYAYKFAGGVFSELDPTKTWQGTDSDFFWTVTYWPQGATSTKYMWATNFNNAAANPDPLRYFNGANWIDFTPLITAIDTLYTCECIIPYKSRLLFFNTWEGTTVGTQTAAANFPQRLRYSQLGDPTTVDAFRSDIVGKGGFVDAPTSETIVSVEFIKDVVIVKFERSSWKIVYTGNETFPFYFEKINTELGAESTFSLVPFDRGIFSVGNVGVMTDDSVNVYRIDQKIPQTVFDFRNADNGPERVHGIRDYVNELVYWCFPNYRENLKFPNKVLVYNYVNQSYAIFNDSFTCYGYYQNSTSKTWSEYTEPTQTWILSNFLWSSGSQQPKYPDIVAGNQQGFVSLLNQSVGNGFSLAINSITPAASPNLVTIESVNHNLQTGDFVTFSSIIGTGTLPASLPPLFPPNPSITNPEALNYDDNDDPANTAYNPYAYRVAVIDEDTFNIEAFDPITQTFTGYVLEVGGSYLGGGRITRISNINITTKVFAPFYESGGQTRLGYLDFLLDATEDGELTCDVFIDEQDITSVTNPYVTVDSLGNPDSGLLGNNTLLTKPENTALIPMQPNQNKIWHRFFVQSISQNFQLQIYMSDVQMAQNLINQSQVVLHAMTIYLSKNARMTQ